MALSQNSPPPRHIAIIMDGNGRWAKNRGLPRTAGHAAGAEAFRRIANYCRTLGVEYLTVYAFSTENWKRSAEEVAGIMKLLRRYLEEALRDMGKEPGKIPLFRRPDPSQPGAANALPRRGKPLGGLRRAGEFLPELRRAG